jgi:hypothetical protein
MLLVVDARPAGEYQNVIKEVSRKPNLSFVYSI